jgi:redox-sensing transcriptional repressor
MNEEGFRPIPEPTLRRLPRYHQLLEQWLRDGVEWVSCARFAEAVGVDPTQVRKDLACLGVPGRRRVGYPASDLRKGIERFLGWNHSNEAFLAGAGHLGTALLNYTHFADHGLEIVAAFEADPQKVGQVVNGKQVLPLEKLAALARRMHVRIGVITVPASAAQFVADQMVAGGIQAIWNFAPTALDVPEGIIVQDEDLFSSLAVLSRRLEAGTGIAAKEREAE